VGVVNCASLLDARRVALVRRAGMERGHMTQYPEVVAGPRAGMCYVNLSLFTAATAGLSTTTAWARFTQHDGFCRVSPEHAAPFADRCAAWWRVPE